MFFHLSSLLIVCGYKADLSLICPLFRKTTHLEIVLLAKIPSFRKRTFPAFCLIALDTRIIQKTAITYLHKHESRFAQLYLM